MYKPFSHTVFIIADKIKIAHGNVNALQICLTSPFEYCLVLAARCSTQIKMETVLYYISALTSFIASATYTMPAMRFMIFSAFGDCRRTPR